MILNNKSEIELPGYQRKKKKMLTYKLSVTKRRRMHVFQDKNNLLITNLWIREVVKSLSELPGKDCVRG